MLLHPRDSAPNNRWGEHEIRHDDNPRIQAVGELGLGCSTGIAKPSNSR